MVRTGVALSFLFFLLIRPEATVLSQTVQGYVLESGTEIPVFQAEVTLLDTTMVVVDRTYSAYDGFFTLMAPDPGRYYVRARALGYRTKVDGIVELDEGGLLPLTLFLVPDPVPLEGIEVMTERQLQEHFLEVQGFYERKAMGFGYFITPEEIEERFIRDWHRLFQGTPVEATAALSFNKWEMRGRCGRAKTFVNGMEALGDVEIYDVLAVEIYAGIASTPLQWTRPGYCGAILIWTKGG